MIKRLQTLKTKDPNLTDIVKQVQNEFDNVYRNIGQALPQATGTFTASPTDVSASGTSVTLSWTSQGAVSASIVGVGVVALAGSRTITLSAPATYTLELTNVGGAVTRYTVSLGFTSSGTVVVQTGVTQIIAGSNISISPTSGVGAVTVSATVPASGEPVFKYNSFD